MIVDGFEGFEGFVYDSVAGQLKGESRQLQFGGSLVDRRCYSRCCSCAPRPPTSCWSPTPPPCVALRRCVRPSVTVRLAHGAEFPFRSVGARSGLALTTRGCRTQAWRPEAWDLAAPMCAWPGVKCKVVDVTGSSFFSGKQKRSVVHSISLRNVCEFVPEDLTCEIGAEIGSLHSVESLYLAGNGKLRCAAS
jgi:hypothetical protein